MNTILVFLTVIAAAIVLSLAAMLLLVRYLSLD